MNIEADIIEGVCRDFPAEAVPDVLKQLENASSNSRVQRCIVFASRGHPRYFDFLCQLAKIDYRDVIMAAEYGHFGLRLYDFTKPFHQARIDESNSTNGPDPTKI